MAAAYRYADGGGPAPRELDLLRVIDRFGAQAVLGRPLSAREVGRLLLAESVVQAYRAWRESDHWGRWMREHAALWQLLERARKARNAETHH